jgi:hypothetical protein
MWVTFNLFPNNKTYPQTFMQQSHRELKKQYSEKVQQGESVYQYALKEYLKKNK